MRILLAEDDEDHAILTTRAIRAAQPNLQDRLTVTTVSDGEQALAYLRGEDPFGDRTLPDLMLLDLNMPVLDGLEVLRRMRADPALRAMPVIVLSTSARDDDVVAAYRLGANAFVTKPVTVEEFRAKVQSIPVYWSTVIKPPPAGVTS